MTHDRIHARKPGHDIERWMSGTVGSITQRDGHCVVVVTAEGGDTVELTVTLAVRDLFCGRLDIDDGASPVGERVWFREHGGA
jgi:hypothetical protein